MSRSAAVGHFPQVVVLNGKKWLFNPILKKRYENRPEERVRLRWVEYLLLEAGWKRTRIAFEAPVRLRQHQHSLRADLILYDEALLPNILIECKSESAELNQAVAEQAGRYNSEVNARQLILTNGMQDLCFSRREESFVKTDLPFLSGEEAWRTRPGYWSARGFCPTVLDQEESWLASLLVQFWGTSDAPRYLDVELNETIPASHYYRLFSFSGRESLAITFAGYGGSESWMLALLNEQDRSHQALVVSLSRLLEHHPENSQLIRAEGMKSLDLRTILHLPIAGEPERIADFLENLPLLIRSFF